MILIITMMLCQPYSMVSKYICYCVLVFTMINLHYSSFSNISAQFGGQVLSYSV